ncbi:hypothetical protein RHMOL_Rhmol01G0034400 [Rhododendron molle]|uniref:Uncharacterized protein n=1 Tax=Rhododendron molle TaxID=49168 RepID=A0ACC0PXY6_RHOML|nr:hypothetical protein RHMOL_Rhmol01G0034400 [Rhododendron molle]
MATRTKSRYPYLQAFGFTDIKVPQGRLQNGQEVAVKRLLESSKQGQEEFINELTLTAKLQHVNLAYELWKDGKSMEFMDSLMDDTSSGCKLLRCMQVALLCIQEKWEDRQTMLEVYSMLKNEIEDVSAPKRPAFSTKTDMDEENHHKSREEICSANFATISQVMPR